MRARARWPHFAFATHCAVTAFCVIGPGYRWWGAGARPFVLGLPWSFAWVLLWLFATFAVLVAYEAWWRRTE